MTRALLLLVAAVLMHLPMLRLQEWRGTEARRVQIAQEMAAAEDPLIPTLGGEPTLAKPPLHYWLLIASDALLGRTKESVRLPSVLLAWLLAVVAHRVVRREHDERAAWIAAVGVLTAPALLWHTPTAEIDPAFASLTAISILLLGHGAAHGLRPALAGGGVAGGLALLAKGPPYFLFLAGALLVWLRRRRLRGFGWFALPLLVVPALYYAPLIGRLGLAELLSVAGEESVGRVTAFELEHLLDVPMHFVRAALLLLPLAYWTFHEWRGSPLREAQRIGDGETALRICAAAAIGGILLLALFPARPARYLLPSVALYVCAVAPAVAGSLAPLPPTTVQRRILFGIGLLGCAIVGALPWVPGEIPWRAGVLGLVLAGTPLVVRLRRGVVATALLLPAAAAVTLHPELARRQTSGLRAARPAAALLRAELAPIGRDELATRGHVPAPLLADLGWFPPADEFLRREPQHRWLLTEHPDRVDGELARPAGYAERLRIRLHRKTLVLSERER